MFVWIKNLFNVLLRTFKTFLKLAIPVAKELIAAQLKDIAIKAVSEMSLTNLSNSEKRNASFNKIGEYAKARGIVVTDSLISWILETALQYIKGGN